MNKDSGHKKKLMTKWLMFLSQLLLTGFVFYWLFGQYKEEEQRLQEDLKRQYIQTQDEEIDKLLMANVINPILKNSVKLSVDIRMDSIPSSGGDSVKLKTIKTFHTTDSVKQVFALKMDESSGFTKIQSDSLHFFNTKQEDVLTRSVRLIISGSDEMFPGDSLNFFHFSESIDTSLLKRTYSDELKNKGFSFDLEWIDDSADVEFSRIFIKSEFPNKLHGVYIKRYKPYILGLMFPQILFAVLLLGLSAFVFFFSYRNLKKQITLNTIRNNFVSNITHELKTPISTIMVALEALKGSDLKENKTKTEEYLNLMNDEAVRLDSLISKVMLHTKLENKAEILNKEQTNLSNIIQQAVDKIKLQTAGSNIRFIPTEKEIWATVDKLYMFGVIFNLLDNSLKYAGQEAQIKVGVLEDKQNIILTVSDNGPGIPQKYLPRLFDTFFRVPKGDTHNIKGSGLGLSYVKLVMTEHGGSVKAENLADGGFKFTLKFPK